MTNESNQDPDILSRATIEDWLGRYQPAEISSVEWRGDLGNFVRHAMLRVDNFKRYPALQRTTLLFARLSKWSMDEGLALDLELVLDKENIERWTEEANRTAKTARSDRAAMRRLGIALTTAPAWTPRPLFLPAKRLSPPYTVDEVASLWRYAAAQSTAARHRAARTLLALGLGAGLSGASIRSARPGHLRYDDDAVLIETVTPIARTVPILARYEETVLELVHGLSPSEYIAGSMSRVRYGTGYLSATLDNVGPGNSRPIDARRLRSTWIVHQMRAGTPLNVVFLASGLTPSSRTDSLAAFLPDVSFGDYKRLLRNA
jgi:hypothetical protein